MTLAHDRLGIEVEVFGTVNEKVSPHLDSIEYLCAIGEPGKASELISEISSYDRKSYYIAWELVKHAAVRVGDLPLTRRAGHIAALYEPRP